MLHRVEWSVMVHYLRTPAPRAWEVGTKDWEWGVTSCGVPQSQLSWSSGSKSIHLTTGRRQRNGVSPVIAMNKNVTFSSGHNNILFHELKWFFTSFILKSKKNKELLTLVLNRVCYLNPLVFNSYPDLCIRPSHWVLSSSCCCRRNVTGAGRSPGIVWLLSSWALGTSVNPTQGDDSVSAFRWLKM